MLGGGGAAGLVSGGIKATADNAMKVKITALTSDLQIMVVC